ncbi:MAG: methylated-DNA--[protein]-cysteine S-methyltransferase [Planctomycetota bacterium]|nr:MAG: methylated-DNA--[protein]-cysteine S-methyltransferase [Planctomycetota bacterium]
MEKVAKYVIFGTRWGYFGLAGDDRGLWRSCLPGRRDYVKFRLLKGLVARRRDRAFMKGLQELVSAYYEGACVDFGRDIPVVLDEVGEFGRGVLESLRRDVKYGETISYGELAGRVGRVGAARAVGGALARNPLPLIIPCHRVICANGKLGGFSGAGGARVKKRMLDFERKMGA